jgi:hypothetical protein
MERLDQGVGGLGEIHRVIALYGLIEKGEPEREHQPQNEQERPGF